MSSPRRLAKRRPGGRLTIIGVVGLMLAGLLGVIVIGQGGGSRVSAVAPLAGPTTAARRLTSPLGPAVRRRQDASARAPAHLFEPGATQTATVADGLVPTPAHPPAGWAVTAHQLASGGLERYYLVARPAVTQSAVTRPAVTQSAATQSAVTQSAVTQSAVTQSAVTQSAAGPGAVIAGALTARAVAARSGPAPSPGGSLPVLVVLHGRMMTPSAMMAMSHFLSQVGRAIVVYPSGYDESWNAGYCCGGANRAGVNDVAFLSAVVHQVLAQQPGARPNQVYLAGYSNGGRLAYRMACDVPGMFAGVAAVEAISVSSCASSDPVPLLIVASQDDPVLTIGLHAPPKHIEDHAETTVQAEVDKWRALEGCAAGNTEATLGDLSTQTWNHCAGDGRVEAAVYGGGSHAWFNACRSTPSAQALIWAFFHNEAPTAKAGVGPACPLHPRPGKGAAPPSPGRTVIK